MLHIPDDILWHLPFHFCSVCLIAATCAVGIHVARKCGRDGPWLESKLRGVYYLYAEDDEKEDDVEEDEEGDDEPFEDSDSVSGEESESDSGDDKNDDESDEDGETDEETQDRHPRDQLYEEHTRAICEAESNRTSRCLPGHILSHPNLVNSDAGHEDTSDDEPLIITPSSSTDSLVIDSAVQPSNQNQLVPAEASIS